jgi:hypothetical protein
MVKKEKKGRKERKMERQMKWMSRRKMNRKKMSRKKMRRVEKEWKRAKKEKRRMGQRQVEEGGSSAEQTVSILLHYSPI